MIRFIENKIICLSEKIKSKRLAKHYLNFTDKEIKDIFK